jgi:AcrR family transcriptional regulator
MSHVSLIEAPAAPVWDAPELTSQEERIVAAGLRCFARWGVGKTTLDDVARESGYSRATVYRFFPGGKDGLVDAIVRTECGRFFATVARRLDAARDLEELIVVAITETARLLGEHSALQYMLAHEPEIVLPRIAFHEMGEVLSLVSAFGAPYLRPFLADDADPRRVAEWIGRIVLSYICCPSDAVDLGSDESVRSLVRTFVLPGLALPT